MPNSRADHRYRTRRRKAGLLVVTLFLTACTPPGDGNGPVEPPPPLPEKEPGTVVSAPGTGFWNGAIQQGPWCSTAKTQSTRLVSTTKLTEPTDTMRKLRGFRELPPVTSVQNTSSKHFAIMGLLPTGIASADGMESLRRHLPPSLRLTDQFGYWVRLAGPSRDVKTLVDGGSLQYAEPEVQLQPSGLAAPTDVNLPNQAAYFRLLNLDRTWRYMELGCPSPVVAVLDSGMQAQGGNQQWNLLTPDHWYNAVTNERGNATSMMEGNSHGARVASMIGTVSNDGLPGSSVANNLVKVLPINVMDAAGTYSMPAVARGIEYAIGAVNLPDGRVIRNAKPAHIINLSLAEDPGATAGSEFLASYVERATNQGVVVVAAAGNSNARVNVGLAANPLVIGVGGVDVNGRRWQQGTATGSNYGKAVTVAGPAEQVGTYLNGFVEITSGTSVATPWVAAQIGLWMYANQHYRPDHSPTNGLHGAPLIQHLRRCLNSVGSNKGIWDEQTGFGVIDTALLVVRSNPACHP